MPYNSGGYTASMTKNGPSRFMGGTAADSKTVEGQTSANYNSGGYTGNLSRYVFSGEAGEREVEIPVEAREGFAKGVLDGLGAYLEVGVGVGLEWGGEKKEGYVVGILRNKLDYWGTPYEIYLDYAEGTAMIVSLGSDTKKDSEKYYEGYFGDDIVMLITNDKGVK